MIDGNDLITDREVSPADLCFCCSAGANLPIDFGKTSFGVTIMEKRVPYVRMCTMRMT